MVIGSIFSELATLVTDRMIRAFEVPKPRARPEHREEAKRKKQKKFTCNQGDDQGQMNRSAVQVGD